MLAHACGLGDAEHGREPEPTVLFDCGSGKSRIRLLDRGADYLAIEKQLDPGRMTLETFMWSDVRIGSVVGQQGGRQTHVRFEDRGESFVLFEGEDGQLADNPGRTYAGVVQIEGSREVGRVDCAYSKLNARLLTAVVEYYRRNGIDELAPEAHGGPFDAWF